MGDFCVAVTVLIGCIKVVEVLCVPFHKWHIVACYCHVQCVPCPYPLG